MMVRLLLETLWRTARLAQFDAYLGNPDTNGPATTAYAFRLIPKPERPENTALSTALEPSPTGIAAFSVAMLTLIAGLAVAWARS
jgi:hypothetical protein